MKRRLAWVIENHESEDTPDDLTCELKQARRTVRIPTR